MSEIDSICEGLANSLASMGGNRDVMTSLLRRAFLKFEQEVTERTQQDLYQRYLERADLYEHTMGKQDGKADLMRYLAKVALEDFSEADLTEERSRSS